MLVSVSAQEARCGAFCRPSESAIFWRPAQAKARLYFLLGRGATSYCNQTSEEAEITPCHSAGLAHDHKQNALASFFFFSAQLSQQP